MVKRYHFPVTVLPLSYCHARPFVFLREIELTLDVKHDGCKANSTRHDCLSMLHPFLPLSRAILLNSLGTRKKRFGWTDQTSGEI